MSTNHGAGTQLDISCMLSDMAKARNFRCVPAATILSLR